LGEDLSFERFEISIRGDKINKKRKRKKGNK